MEKIIGILASEFGRQEQNIKNVITLIDEGNTIPFIARYRKEMHGSMDDSLLRELETRLGYLRNLESRKEEIKNAVNNQGKLTDELAAQIDNAKTLAEAEDLYRPFKQKKRTRAGIAKEKGLEPLAALIFSQADSLPALPVLAEKYINEEKEVLTAEDALAGASDIIAEFISDSPDIRKILREYCFSSASIRSEKAKDEDSVYRQYYDFSQPVSAVPGHRILALNRGEKEGFLRVSLETDKDKILNLIFRQTVRSDSEAADFVKAAAEDAWDRLIFPSLRNELRSALTEKAAEGAIHNFAINLRPLLMQPPVKGHITMGLDPGYRNGCKTAIIDATGKLLDTCVVYPASGEKKKREAIGLLSGLIKKHKVEHIAIGNGTASRETEQMVSDMIKELDLKVSYMIVNEAGASVYSASSLAAEEFPDLDVNLRSAVSIARRLQDPLAELVKIDPKAIGVGQYQHDMPQKRLDETLSGVVEDCVNAVGVDLNTASPALLQRVSGLNSSIAGNIVAYREANGAFSDRKQLLKVPRLGARTYEQCAGFLRISGGRNPLDNTGVHPESYKAAEVLIGLCGCGIDDISSGKTAELGKRLRALDEKSASKKCGIGIPTLRDIAKELAKPGRDPRDELPRPVLRTDVLEAKDLVPGMILTGTVRNVIDFGAFVDIGVHQDGLVHISEITDKYIRHPSEILSVGDVIKVTVLSVDETGKRISLSAKQAK
ncbi:MAG: Tex family protein [Bacillota bacterium]|nr:Tex family protein [Bacillota bacterium]